MTIHMDIYDSIHYWNSLKFERESVNEYKHTLADVETQMKTAGSPATHRTTGKTKNL